MADPTPDFILGWLACQEAAVQAVPNGWADQPHVSALEYGPLTAAKAISAIRALPPPGDLRAALAALVKPLVWETDPRWTGTEWGVPTFDGQYQINDQCDGSWLLTKPNGDDILTDTLEAARAAAEEDHRRRVVAAIMGDEG